MIPSDVRLFTWIDVEEVVNNDMENNGCPDWLVWVRAYWDSLTIGIRSGANRIAKDWLRNLFDPRFDEQQTAVILESLVDSKRFLPVVFEETTEEPLHPRLMPSLRRPSFLCAPAEKQSAEEPELELPPVVAFHSFKGGVGRTLHAMALARAISEQHDDSRVLFIDADLEAPGVTWLVQKRFPNLPVSFADLLALVHGDSDPEGRASIELVADRLREMLLDKIWILPAFRTPAQFTSLEVRPEHLFKAAKNPFILTNIVARLGSALGAGAVLVDLRAGLSELSAPFLLDPRVYRVLVTTPSSQSIEGTCREIELLGRRAPSKNEYEPIPALIFSQVPEDYVRNGLIVQHEERLLEAARPFLEEEMPRLVTSFDPRLQVLPDSWTDVMKRISQTGLIPQIHPLVEWLPLRSPEEEQAGFEEGNLRILRRDLAEFSNKLIYAERGDITEFLSIPPLKNLASDFISKNPIAVVVGAKGAGKTYTFLMVVLRKNWQGFVRDVGIIEGSVAAPICPVLKSKNLQGSANLGVLSARTETGKELGHSGLPEPSQISDFIRDSLREDLHEGQWRERWLDIIAWSTGYETSQAGAGRKFTQDLDSRKMRVIAVMDGLEDLFQDLSSDTHQQTAVRSLIQDVPEWLEQQPGRSIGLLVFIRQDMVLNAVRQNAAQLMARYEPYALKWSSEEALRLAAWIATKKNLLPSLEKENLQRLNKETLTTALIPLWGRKLGSERSKEARSAEWIIAALSDLKGQIQARDLVRFLHEAAKNSEKDTYWKDRILVPSAIKEAVKICSEEKIKEIEIENTRLKEIFIKLLGLKSEDRQIPFEREQVGLSVEELKTLEDNGVALREGEEYYMPEIFRAGLGFKLKAGARPRVLALSRKVRK